MQFKVEISKVKVRSARSRECQHNSPLILVAVHRSQMHKTTILDLSAFSNRILRDRIL